MPFASPTLPLPVGLLHRIRSVFAIWCLGCLLSQHLLLADDRPSQEAAINLIKTSEAFSSEQQQFLLNGFGHGNRALSIEYLYIADTFALVRGGALARKVARYLGDLEINASLDTSKLGLWHGGEFFLHLDVVHGRSLSPKFVGDFQIYDEYEPYPRTTAFTQVTEYWFKQTFGDRLTIKLGKQDANRDFIYPEIGAEFVHSSFSLIPTMPLPTYPNCSLGAAVFFECTERTTLRFGVYDGASFLGQLAGAGSGFETVGKYGALQLFEVQHRFPWHKQLPSNLRLGAWYHTASFAVPSLGLNARRRGNHGLYFSAEQMLWRENCQTGVPQGFTAFCQYAFSPSDRNFVERYFGFGGHYRGLLPGREKDALGCGMAICKLSPSVLGVQAEGAEVAVELFYKAYVTPYLRVQPECQFIKKPSGFQADAFLVGIRVEVAL